MKWLNYWGKTDVPKDENGKEIENVDIPFHRLAYHCLDVTACAIRLIERSDRLFGVLHRHVGISREQMTNLVAWSAMLHDLGKLSPSFQRQSHGVSKVADILGVGPLLHEYDVRHDNLGFVLWNDILRNDPEFSCFRRENVKTLIQCATGHHGKPPANAPQGHGPVNPEQYFGGEDIAAAKEMIDWATQKFQPEFPHRDGLQRASWWIAGIITLADWLGSGKDYFTFEAEKVDLDEYLLQSLAKADRIIDDTGIIAPTEKRGFDKLFQFQPTPVQQAVIDLTAERDEPFFLIVEESTGGGKTEAALAAAKGSNLFFGLPTQATANGLWSRIKGLGGQQSLAHAKSWLVSESMDRASAWLNNSNRLALLSDISLGTIDQAMIGVMFARYGMLRLAGLAGKTLIIDEVHAYDPYMKRIIETLVTMQARSGGSVILLSATMPLKHRSDYAKAWSNGIEKPIPPAPPAFSKTSFPLITFVDQQGNHEEIDGLESHYKSGRRVVIQRSSNRSCIVDRIVKESGAGRCAVWIRNTVGEAIEACDELKAQGVDVMLFHSRFVAGHRREIEDTVLQTFGKESTPEQRRRKVLVATQVVEQSLDLDFDFMVTDLCPVDLLIQRAGRLHRHPRGDRGEPILMLYAPEDNANPGPGWINDWSLGTGYVYENHAALWNTLRIIGDGFTLPQDARRLVEGVFGDNVSCPPKLRKQANSNEGKTLLQALAANNATINPSSWYSFQQGDTQTWNDETAPTRLGDPVREWVICESGRPITGNVFTSTISLRLVRVKDAPKASIKVSSFQQAMNLINGYAECSNMNGPIDVTYDKQRGLMY
ncbi:CRISPR-associated helicase Cas3' [Ferrovum sp.]|uniref:CRISPR-associated helicase Cas3' n=1 Tax=Ferrovum sp. TaxID=2609467 RepID=UPI0026341D10|nr:CRISPR-associated helicase Cas3' [Ferrovum sp.]